MEKEWSRPILTVKNDRKIEPLNMPDFNNGLQNPPRWLPTQNFGVRTQQILAYILRTISGKDEQFFNAVNPSESPTQF